MTTMCNFCDSDTRKRSSGDPNNLTFRNECEKNNASTLNGEHPQLNASEFAKGDSPVLMSTQTRENGVKVLDSCQSHLNPPFAEQLEEDGSSVKSPYFTYTRNSLNGTWCRGSMEGNCGYNSLAQENHGKSCSEKGEEDKSIVGNTPCVNTEDDSVGSKEAIDSKLLFLCDAKLDPANWMPPEPEDMDHDGHSFANYDDDDADDYTDGTKWGKPTSLCSLDGENTNRHSHNEERQKAMMATMSGQFMTIVCQLLDSEGMGSSHRENGENWLELVTYLSWEAAQLIKPYSDEGPAMDPLSYVKVKCIASGARNQSQVIKGLVFKKNTAHKHMATKFKHPRLLLFQGALTHSATGLSSFKYMEQEVDYTKFIIEMIETCHPNVVLVEKTVSRDIQEYLLEKGITLVSDMKLPRLSKVALYTGSEIISSANVVMRPKLKQCDSFYVEKFVEEHNSSGEGGKKPNKTLMFLEVCPKPHGCTILLKGAHSDELKKVKRVVHSAVFDAYHLILKTLYFFDQRTLFTIVNAGEVNSTSNKVVPSVTSGVPSVITDKCNPNGSKSDMALTCTVEVPVSGSIDIPIHDGKLNLDFGESSMSPGSDHVVTSTTENGVHMYPFYHNHEGDMSNSSVQVSPGKLLSSISASLRKLLGNNLPSLKTESFISYVGSGTLVCPNEEICSQGEGENGKTNQVEPDDGTRNSQKSSILFNHSETTDKCTDKIIDEMQSESEVCNKGEGADGKTDKEEPGDEIRNQVFDHSKTTENCSDKVADEIQNERKSETGNVPNPRSILVLLSSHCIPRQMVCKRSHLSHIKYYGNFDASLGRYLHDTFFNQHNCSTCGEPPEAHEYRYTHQNGNITVLVTHLPKNATLSGEKEGKIWMWTRCLKCEHENGIPRSTRRVLMSSEACGLSFGKFLELNFSCYYAVRMLSKCGHQLHRDCLRFFGLGSKVAMFRYSPVEVYAASKMPQVLEFFNSSGQEWFARESRDILSKGDIFFMEAGNILKKLKPKCSSNSCPTEKLDEVQEMLIRDRTEFEASLLKAIYHHAEPLGGECHILDLNWLIQELLLMLYVWDRRLHFILSWTRDSDHSNGTSSKEKLYEANDVIFSDNYIDRNMTENGTVLVGSGEISVDIVEFSSRGSHLSQNHAATRTQHESESTEVSGYTAEARCLIGESSPGSMAEECSLIGENISRNACEVKCIPILEDIQDNNTVPIVIGSLETVEGISVFENSKKTLNCGEMDSDQESKNSKLEDSEKWIWSPFSKVRKELKMDLYGGFLQKFEFINTYTPSYLSPMHQLANQVRSSLHFTFGPDGNVISVVEDEISSIIACSLVLYEDLRHSWEIKPEKEGKKVKVNIDTPINNSRSVSPNGSTTSLQWSATEFLESELASLGSDLSLFMNRIIPIENLHPEISFGFGKVPGKSKYSVVCIYGKQFYNLRKRCCSSEKAYITSLTRCKKWDAQGGKSKVLFAKTMDDRFIIKQIKKPELQSFLKFGPDYFKHVSVCLDSGSQICLAKVLGLYQVRQYKSGKEVKNDVVVMENLFFGRSTICKYDLKGAVFSRYVQKSNDSESVLLDENFVEDMRVSPIYLSGKTKHLLERAIWNDTAFLTANNVMDYSLLVGIDNQKHEIVFGIIDYLRQYTWDKHLETWVKAYLVVPKNELPTVISPKDYKKRFRKFMTKYFLTFPDTWSSDLCSGSCKLCTNGSSTSSNLLTGRLQRKLNLAYEGIRSSETQVCYHPEPTNNQI